MKKAILLILAFACSSLFASAQTTVSIRLSPATGEYAYVSDFYPVTNISGYSDIVGVAWTQTGTPYVGRTYFKYDLSGIPANAFITSATLSLFHNNAPTQPAHSTLSGSNAAFIKQVTGSWTGNSITWTNKPSTTAAGQIPLAASTSATDDYLNIDVTQMVSNMVSSPATNYGFMLQLQNEMQYRSLNFASGSNADTTLHPLLEITYNTNMNCDIIRLDTLTGTGAYVSDFYPTSNFAGYSDLVGVAWTQTGTPYVGRSYFGFDFSGFPGMTVVLSATLSLYANPTNTQPVHSTLTGSNASLIQKVTGSWNENTITWTNKPATTSTGEVLLQQSNTQFDDYLNIDVTQLVSQMISMPSSNYGLMLKLQNETNYRSMNFGSISCSDTLKRPKLVLCYMLPSGIDEHNDSQNHMTVYPNPSNGDIHVTFDKFVDKGDVQIINLLGELIYSEKFNGKSLLVKKDMAAGMYVLRITSGDEVWVEKITVDN